MVANRRLPQQNPNEDLLAGLKEKIKRLPDNLKGPIAEDIEKLELTFTKSAVSAGDPAEYGPFSPNLSWESILNHLIAGVIFYDQQGIVRLANDYILSLFGFDPVGIPREQLYLRLRVVDTKGKRIPGDKMPASHAARGETISNMPLTITVPDGRKYHIMASAMPLYEGEQIIGVASVWNDVTGQQNLLDENKRQNDLLKTILDSSPYGLAILTGPELVFRYANSAYQQLSPHPEIDPTGQCIENIWRPEEGYVEGADLIKGVLESGQAASTEHSRIVMPDGTNRFYSLNALSIEWDKQPAVLVMLWDATDLVNARSEAQQRAAEFEAIFNAIADAITVYDASGRLIRVNPAMVQAAGTDPSYRDRIEFFNSLHLTNLDGSPLRIEELPSTRALSGQETRDFTFTFIDANEAARVVRASGSPLRGSNGEITGAVTIWHDVTDLEQKDRQIEAERDRLKTLLESISDEVWFCDPSGAMTLMNERTQLDEGNNSTSKQPSPMREAALDMMEILEMDGSPRKYENIPLVRSLKGETVRGQEMMRNSLTGEIKVREYTSSPIRSKNQILGAVAVVRDITDQKRYEEQLRENERFLKESEERLKVALGSAPQAVFITDLDLRYTWIYSPYMGPLVDRLIGKRDDEVSDAQDLHELLDLKRAALEQGEALSREIKILIPNQSMRLVAHVRPLYDTEGKVIGVIGSALDVTVLRRLEERHSMDLAQVEVQRHLLEHREMERQQIAGKLHDGPVQQLGSLGFAIQAAKGREKDPELSASLAQMSDEVKGLVQELLDVCNELRPPVLARFGLQKAIESHAEDFQKKYPGLKIQLELSERLEKIPDLINLALFRIYQEALNNITRHSRADQVTVRLDFNPEQAVFEIIDNGQGFSPNFNAVDLVRNGHFGLVGMIERAEAIGGQLTIATEQNQGTTIRVVIPWSSE